MILVLGVLFLVATIVDAWGLMLVIGIVHLNINHDFIAVGFWPCFGISVVASIVVTIAYIISYFAKAILE